MDDTLMSKKELLERTNISYGQLYRWKRKNLIPEEWFIRKSTFTGQETFFPREKILNRIEQIKNMKDDLSLDELADRLTANASNVQLSIRDFTERNIVTSAAVELVQAHNPSRKIYSFDDMLCIYVVDVALQSGEVNQNECRSFIEMLELNYAKLRSVACSISLVRKLGVGMCVMYPSKSDVTFDKSAKVVLTLDLEQCAEELRLKLL